MTDILSLYALVKDYLREVFRDEPMRYWNADYVEVDCIHWEDDL